MREDEWPREGGALQLQFLVEVGMGSGFSEKGAFDVVDHLRIRFHLTTNALQMFLFGCQMSTTQSSGEYTGPLTAAPREKCWDDYDV